MVTWDDIAGGREEQYSLVEAALLVAEEEYPALDPGQYLGQVDHWVQELERRLGPGAQTEDRVIELLNDFLFREWGFSGNQANYFDPRNSYLNDVIDRRLGIPVSLSIIYLELAGRLGLEMDGINFPGHFLVRCRIDGELVYLDPYRQGQRLDVSDLDHLLQRSFGHQGVSVESVPELVEPVGKRHMLLRLLRNLKLIHTEFGNHQFALKVLNRILQVAPDSAEERRERADVLIELECYRGAAKDLERYREQVSDAEEDQIFIRSWQRLESRSPSYH